MKTQLLKYSLLAGIILLANATYAQEPDVEGCFDHPLFNRMSNYYISDCYENYDEYTFMMGEDETQDMEGTLTRMTYSYDGPFGPNLPSILQVVKNYETAVISNGGTKIYSKTKSDGSWTGATFKLEKDGSEYWLGIYDLINNPVDQFSFILLIKEGMHQEISINEMFDKLNTGDALTLYINFDTGKSTIKSESQNIVDELYTLLNENAALKIMIEGYTDNAGRKEANQVLSEQRAESLKKALTDKGITDDRIKTVGYGQENPIGNNNTEEGKDKNRRIEIRKI